MNSKYDVIIIGAGIGGLVCGCYLAKEGLKVLIFEQHSNPGGYCTSFERSGYRFDVGVHYLGSMQIVLGKVLEELELKDEIKFDRFDPTDKIIMPDNITYIHINPQDTIEDFKRSFPREKRNIERFFEFIMQKDFFNVYKKIKSMSFQGVLNEFFEDYRLKATLEVLLLNFGLSAKKASAIASVILYRYYILDGGYYPRGGMQGFSNSLASRFKRYGGELLLRKKVEEILVENKKIKGVILESREVVKANIVVSNADATQTFCQLLRRVTCPEKKLVNKLCCSHSLFALYVGTDKDLKTFHNELCNIWSFDTYKIDGYISNLKESILTGNLPFCMISFPSAHASELKDKDKNTIQSFLIAPFESESFWDTYKDETKKNLIKRTQKLLPGLAENIKVNTIATPITFYKYTLNKNGAAFGWASILNQVKSSLFPPMTSLDALFLVGHWCTIGSGQGGVPKAIFSGRKVSYLILKKWIKVRNTKECIL